MADQEKDEITLTQSGDRGELARASQQKQWLVKANSEVLGPFSFEEICQNLRDRRFVPHDEVVAPQGRWKLIRQADEFRAVVNEIKNRQILGDKNSEITASTFGGVETSTGKLAALMGFGNVLPVTQTGAGAQNPTSETNAGAQSQGASNQPSRDLVKSYSFTGDPQIQKRAVRSESAKLIAAIAVFLVAAAFYFVRFTTQLDLGKSHLESFQDILAAGKAAEELGDYSKAMVLYSDARNMRPNDPELLIRMAPLLLTFEKQPLQAARLFKEIYESTQILENKVMALMGQGLVALDAHELDRALSFFTQTLKIQAGDPAALFNIGMVHFYKDEFTEAEGFFSRALEKAGQDGTVIMALAENSVAQSEDGSNKAKLIPAYELVKAYVETKNDYQGQILIQTAYILSLVGKGLEAYRLSEKVLDLDPESSDLFLRDWRIYRERTSWDQTVSTLNKLLPRISSSPRMTALKGLAMFQGREKVEGAKEIESALSQAPRDALLQALMSWVEFKLGNKEKAIPHLKASTGGSGRYVLPMLVMARYCMEEKDFDCAQKNWEQILQLEQKNLAAYHGLAEIAWQKKDKQTAIRWLRQGQALEAKYIPYHILASQIGELEPGQ